MKIIIESFVRKVVAAQPLDSLAEVARLMEQHNVGAVVIAENHRPVGILTDRDLALELGARGKSPETEAVKVMSTPAITVALDESIFSITQTLRESRVRRLPIVDEDGILVGIVTADDLLRVLGSELANLADIIGPEVAVR